MICNHVDQMSDDDYFAKEYSFFAHFNRIAMQRGKEKVWSVHYRGICYQASKIRFEVLLETQFKPESRQPRAVLKGKARRVGIEKGVLVVA